MEPTEISLAEARTRLADIVNVAAVRGQITYLTSRGRRIAAIVPVVVADAAADDLVSERPHAE